MTGLKLEGNLPPELYITSPQDGTFYYEGSNVMLIASAYDPEDGELRVEWESDLDGPIAEANWSTGSRGVHHLTASATDSGGLTASEQVTIYIGVEPQVPVFLPLVVRNRGIGGSASTTRREKRTRCARAVASSW